MTLTVGPSHPEGAVAAPPSKSMTHRLLVLTALSHAPCVVGRPLIGRDTMATVDGLRALGAEVSIGVDADVFCERLRCPDWTIDVRNSGTTLRLLTGVASLLDCVVGFDGDASLRTRPMGPLLDALSGLGVEHSSKDGRAPLWVRGPNRGGGVSLRGDISSQFISSLLIAGPMTEEGISIDITSESVSGPYIDLTVDAMRSFGAEVRVSRGRYDVPSTGYAAADPVVPGDWSSAAFPLVAGALGGKVTVSGLERDAQGDRAVLDHLRTFGARVTESEGGATVSNGTLRAADLDVSACPDLFPVLCVLAAFADGTSTIRGAPHLRLKESDRIASTASMLTAMGIVSDELPDGLVVHGGEPGGAVVDAQGDHRIAMAAAVAGTAAGGAVHIRGEGSIEVSYPSFVDDMVRIGADMGVSR